MIFLLSSIIIRNRLEEAIKRIKVKFKNGEIGIDFIWIDVDKSPADAIRIWSCEIESNGLFIEIQNHHL